MTTEDKPRRKPGPLARPENARHKPYTLLLDPSDAEQGKLEAGGLSQLVRRLLVEHFHGKQVAGAVDRSRR